MSDPIHPVVSYTVTRKGSTSQFVEQKAVEGECTYTLAITIRCTCNKDSIRVFINGQQTSNYVMTGRKCQLKDLVQVFDEVRVHYTTENWEQRMRRLLCKSPGQFTDNPEEVP